MKNTHLESRIYFTEKDIYDALMSSKRKMSIPLLMELARDKGILVSSEDTREETVKYLSSLVYDYYDLNVLIDHITPSHKKEKSKVTKINTKINPMYLKSVAKEIAKDNIIIQITTDPKNQNKTTLKVEYDEVDFSKTRLRQKIRRVSTIELTEEKGVTTISKPSNNKIDEIMQNILSAVEKKSSIKITENKINLFALKHEEKIKYFTNLITSIKDCKLIDVVKVTVNYEDNPDIEDDVKKMITNASFKGKGLLLTPEYQNLKNDGYYITSIIWNSNETLKNGNIIQFEASITSSKDCEEVSFSVKGAYRFVEKDEYTSGLRPLKSEELIKYTSFLENSAFEVYNKIAKKES